MCNQIIVSQVQKIKAECQNPETKQPFKSKTPQKWTEKQDHKVKHALHEWIKKKKNGFNLKKAHTKTGAENTLSN